jgi:hypothetical protein
MPTLILSARQTEDAQLLWRACIAANWTVTRVHDWRVPPIDGNEIAVYGEPLFVRHVAHGLRLKLQEPPLEWLPKLSPAWRGREVRLTTLAQARTILTQCFIKPAGEKCFDAKIYASGNELCELGFLPENLPVLVQEVVAWEREYRCFVLERQVVTLSSYWRDGHTVQAGDGSWSASETELQTAKAFCERVLADNSVLVSEAVVIDVGVIRDRGWAVIESNAATSSGIYGCDPARVLPLLLRACKPLAETQTNG